MNDLVDVFRRNRRTFYNFADNRLQRVWPRYLGMVAGAVFITAIAGIPSDTLISSMISALAILAGFGFSTQLFLVDHKFDVVTDPSVIEDRVSERRVRRVAREVFDNVAYLNVICLAGVVESICMLIPTPSLHGPLASLANAYDGFAPYVGTFVLTFLALETIATFLRITARVSFIFDKVRPALTQD